MTTIQLGCSPLSWINSDIPELGKGNTAEMILQQIGEIGYKGVELEDPFRKVIDRLPQLLKSNRLRLIGGWHSTFILENSYDQELENLNQHMELLASLGGDRVILAECTGAVHREPTTGLSKRPVLNEEQWERLAEGLDQLAQHARKQGFVTAYHHHMGTVIQTDKEIDTLMKKTKHLGLLFDTGHLLYAQAVPQKILQKHIRRITHVHCKNVRPDVLIEKLGEDAPFFTAILDGAFTVPGDPKGAGPEQGMDFKTFIQTLLEYDYQGWVVMEAEQDPAQAHPYSYADMGYQTLSSYLEGSSLFQS